MLDAPGLTAPFERCALPGRVDQNASHDARTDSKEMRAVMPVDISGIDQAQEGFVHNRSRLQSLAGMLPSNIAAGKAPELFVDKRRQTVQSSGISPTPRLQQLCDFRRFHGFSFSNLLLLPA